MAKGFLEIMNDDKPIFFINALCGLGDLTSFLARLDSLGSYHPHHTPVFLLGGFGASPRLMKEMCDRQGVVATIIKNYNFHSQHDNIESFIVGKYVKESRGDKYESWSFCREIFANEDPPFYQYEMAPRYDYKTNTKKEDIKGFDYFLNKKSIIIKPFTATGNAEGFDHDVENNRFWTSDRWVELIRIINLKGYTPVFVGLDSDLQDVPDKCKENHLHFLSYRDLSIEDTTFLLKNAKGCITTNSWEWGVAAKSGVPTVCLYFKNHFFLPIHTPHGPSDFWDNTYIETDFQNVEPSDVFHKIEYMIENKKKPEANYSVAMITLDDKECIKETMDNVAPYVVDDFVIVDGGSTDGTLDIIKKYDNITLLEKKWEDSFEIQKNYALDNTNNEWRLLIDADEQYQHLFWNQLPWYICFAENKGIDCFKVPRINTVDDLTEHYVQQRGWQLNAFNWVNYPDFQQRLYKKNCRYSGRTHERIVGFEKDFMLLGVNILHHKSLSRQDRGIKRESDQYHIEAQKVKERLNIKENEKFVFHYLHNLSDNELVRKVASFIDSFPKDNEFHFALAYDAHGGREYEDKFRDILGENNLIPFASVPEMLHIVNEIKPYIMHLQVDQDIDEGLAETLKKCAVNFIPRALSMNEDFDYLDFDDIAEKHISLYRSQ